MAKDKPPEDQFAGLLRQLSGEIEKSLAEDRASAPAPAVHRRALLDALARGECGPLEEHLKDLKDPDPQAREGAAGALEEDLAILDKEPDWWREADPALLSHLVQEFVALLGDDHRWVVINGLRCLSRLRHAAHHAAPAVRPLIHGNDGEFTVTALSVYSQICTDRRDIVGIALDFLDHPKVDFRHQAANTLQTHCVALNDEELGRISTRYGKERDKQVKTVLYSIPRLARRRRERGG